MDCADAACCCVDCAAAALCLLEVVGCMNLGSADGALHAAAAEVVAGSCCFLPVLLLWDELLTEAGLPCPILEAIGAADPRVSAGRLLLFPLMPITLQTSA